METNTTESTTKRNHVKRLLTAAVVSFMLGGFSYKLDEVFRNTFLPFVLMFLVVPGIVAVLFLPCRNYLKIVTAGALS